MKRGKVHKYLGMTLDYSTVGQVRIPTLEHIYEILNDFDKAYPIGGGTKSSSAPAIIFKVNKEYKNLNAK